MVTSVFQQTLPKRFNRFGWPLNALHKHFFRVQQMPRDVHGRILGARLRQHIEKMQTAQRAGGFGAVKKSFEHSDVGRNKFCQILQAHLLHKLTA